MNDAAIGLSPVGMAARHAERAQVLSTTKLIIGGKDIGTASGGTCQHVNPSTGRAQAEVVLAGSAEIDSAVAAARAALPGWAALPGARRRDLLLKLAQLIGLEAEALADIAALEHGATRAAFLGQVAMSGEWLAYYAGWADKIEGTFVGDAGGGPFDVVIGEPYGVIAAIVPWNAPLGSMAMKGGAALAAGNTVVFKPPESTPFLALRFGELAREAGFPDGVVNVVPGAAEAGEALIRHRDIDKISFTGSPNTARNIIAASARGIVPSVYELGGKSSNLIFADTDLEAAALYSATYPFTNAGQICVCPSRVLVEDAVYDEVVARMVAIAGALAVGDPLDPATDMGPMISRPSRDRVIEFVTRATARPGTELACGGAATEGDLADGWFVRPIIVTDPDPQSELSHTELFGPVVAVHRFTTEEEAIGIANATRYGLAAYVQTRDITRALRIARRLRAGGVYVNRSFPVLSPRLTFGGVGDSGFGREGGQEGLKEFIRTKSISIDVTGA